MPVGLSVSFLGCLSTEPSACCFVAQLFLCSGFPVSSPFGSRVCSFSMVAKDWQFLLPFHLRLIVICQFL